MNESDGQGLIEDAESRRDELVAWRRRATGLVMAPAGNPIEVVRGRLAIQAQDHRPALWSVGQRCATTSEAELGAHFDAGGLIRTHVLRPTWHLVAPEDLRWLLELTAPRVHRANGTVYRNHGLDPATRHRGSEVIAGALRGGRHLTRSQLAEVLSDAGLPSLGIGLGYLIMHAELSQIVCSGPMQGPKHTYMLIDDRVPPTPRLDPDQAVIELVRRYLVGHGPATVGDLAWWSSLTLDALRRGIDEIADEVRRFDVDDTTWLAIGMPPTEVPTAPQIDLLPTFDEYIIGFSDTRRLVVPGTMPESSPGRFTNTVVLDGLVVGGWRRTFRPGTVEVEVRLDLDLTRQQQDALEATVARYGAFVGRHATLAKVASVTA